MADFDNLSEINENFDTIKTLLNSIRAQGILNTSDVDKLLTGINNKLEKINTEEDIDLIKIFLSELKQNLEERHGVLLSKFGAIESLFSNLLKNSAEASKSSELKELFDIVATNLSVFSREVVSQKETLTDISLRIDALRSDDSQKKDIIKNIALLKPDIERLNNGFDTIVLSLNDNFKTIIKTITSLDKTDYLEKFSDVLSGIEMSSNTLLSAIQVLDKKSDSFSSSLGELVKKDDLTFANQKLIEIVAQGQDISNVVTDFNSRYYKIDNLADKIDASVSIIASLKSEIEESNDNYAHTLINRLEGLEKQLLEISSDSKFEEFKTALGDVLKDIVNSTVLLDKNLSESLTEIKNIEGIIKALDISVSFKSLIEKIEETNQNVNSKIEEVARKLATYQDEKTAILLEDLKDGHDSVLSKIDLTTNNLSSDVDNVVGTVVNGVDKITTKLDEHKDGLSTEINTILHDISDNAENFGVKLNQSQVAISELCENRFGSVFAKITDLKNLVSQIDENSVSANNAIFSSITDRLTLFENSLKNSLETQEKTVFDSSAKLVEQVENIKNISSVLDYKMDTSVVEVGNIKRGFEDLKNAVEAVLALDFVTAVKDLRVDLYASKQELSSALETSSNELNDKLTNDLYGKYELLISKLDNVEDEIKKTQAASLMSLRPLLENISSSIIDVLSYVSENKPAVDDNFSSKLSSISDVVKENSLNYVESVRDVVDVIRIQIENSLKNIEEDNHSYINEVKTSISNSSSDLKAEIQNTYSKLLEVQESYKEIKDIINLNNISSTDRIDGIISSSEGLKADFESKMNMLKNALLDKVTEFKQEFTCENADKVSELKFTVENIYNKTTSDIEQNLASIKSLVDNISGENDNSKTAMLAKILDNFVSLKEFIETLNTLLKNDLSQNFSEVLDNSSSLKDFMSSLNNQTQEYLNQKVDDVLDNFKSIKLLMEKVDENVDGDMTRQLSIIESNFESLVSQISILFDKSERTVSDTINSEFSQISGNMQEIITEKLENYKLKIEETFEDLKNKAYEQSDYLKDRIVDLNSLIKETWQEQSKDNLHKLQEMADTIRSVMDENIKLTSVDYISLKDSIREFEEKLENSNSVLTQDLKSQLDSITRYMDSVVDLQSQEVLAKHDEVNSQIKATLENYENLQSTINTSVENINEKIESGISSIDENLTSFSENSLSKIESGLNKIEEIVNTASDTAIGRINSTTSNTLKTVAEISLATTTQFDNMQNSLIETVNTAVETTKADVKSLSDIIAENRAVVLKLEENLKEENETLKLELANVSSNELQIIDTYINSILEQIELEKQNVKVCKDLVIEFSKKELDIVSKNIEKETDAIISDITEQFDLLRKSQADDIVDLTSRIEEIVNAHIYNQIEDLKSYLDIKTDNTVVNAKLDNLNLELTSSVSDIVNNMNKMLGADVFTSTLSDYKLANEILVTTSVDNLNDKIQEFVQQNIKVLSENVAVNSSNIIEKLNIFDKKFIETLVDKYEEIKLISNNYNNSFNTINDSVLTILSEFKTVKTNIEEQIGELRTKIEESTNLTVKEIQVLNQSFEGLRAQISNKSFDEAFQASINKQIANLESLISQQLEYVEDINELCANNLPDVSELNTLVKYSVLTSIQGFQQKLEEQNVEELVEKELKQLKTDIITQFLNIFNQISFVAEQEEITDFIDEKHEELITILSHIVTNSDEIENVKENVSVVDNKIDSLKDDIELINEKITSIISSDGNIDYVYSLQDLESDIANLRLALNDMKNNDHSKEFNDLISSTNDIYKLVGAIKSELPEKTKLDNIEEEIISISTRTNKLILASDESYKTLQDNLQDFKLVIDDLDERTKNFAKESGIDKFEDKLNAINSMMQNGAKTNQIFNQVFEYLAEWIDNASVQINSISNKVDTLDDIGQIKDMLASLKSNTENNNENLELVDALSTVFEKQTKKILSLESKLDKIIVETTINNSNKLDVTPLENTLNKFLVTIEEKLGSQQDKINSLEEKLNDLIDGKDTAQLTKKMGGMDRQIAKLNKSIEKIASHVVEK